VPHNVDRILTTHVGSLVRPPKLIEFWRAIEDGKPFDAAAFETCLAESVAEVVREQAEVGIDVVSDGEFSKGANWAFYVHKRLSGITVRPATPEEANDPMASVGGGPDHRAFPEFYAEYDAASGLGKRLGNRVIVNGPIQYSNQQVKDIIDLVLQVRVGHYSFEAANPRHAHEWRVWENVKLAPGKVLIPGVISHATNVVEHPELVAERIVRLAKIVGRENVMAGTDCGFAQSPFAQRVHPTIMWAKLRALSEGGRIATKALWGKRAAA
jgi:methionine synthase II (cobalamin-independent)